MSYITFDRSRPYDLVLLGRVAVDFNPVDYFQPLEECTTFKKYVGGSPANIAVGTARHGMKIGFFARVSDDQLGDFVVHFFEKEGIDTYEKFEQYMIVMEKRNADSTRLRTMLGFGERALSAKEKDFFAHWLEEWCLPFELISLAYEKTVDNLHKVNLAYMNAMLKRWYECGFTTPEDIEIGDAKAKAEKSSDASYGDSDAFFDAALKAGFEG